MVTRNGNERQCDRPTITSKSGKHAQWVDCSHFLLYIFFVCICSFFRSFVRSFMFVVHLDLYRQGNKWKTNIFIFFIYISIGKHVTQHKWRTLKLPCKWGHQLYWTKPKRTFFPLLKEKKIYVEIELQCKILNRRCKVPLVRIYWMYISFQCQSS